MDLIQMINIDIDLAVVVLLVIIIDIVTGFAKAISQGEFNSSEMRKGLWHKAGSIGLLFLAAGLTAACQVVDVLPEEFAIVYVPTCLYIFVMEVSSILENILVLNPELDRFRIFQIFGQKHDDDKNEDDTIVEYDDNAWAAVEEIINRKKDDESGSEVVIDNDSV